jgi:group I intron endonuclease
MVKIYSLIDPRSKQIRYIGKTIKSLNTRLNCHIHDCKRHNHHNSNWINSLLKQNLKPIIELIEEVEENDWEFWEKYWIAQFKQWGFILNNLTDGGIGHIGFKKSKEAKIKISNSSKGKLISKEHKEAISKANKGRKLSQYQKEVISKIQKKVLYLYNLENKEIIKYEGRKELAIKFNVIENAITERLSKKYYLKVYRKKYYILKNKEDLKLINICVLNSR